MNRRYQIVAMWKAGATLKSTGEAFGIGGARVRQIVVSESIKAAHGNEELARDIYSQWSANRIPATTKDHG